MELPGFELQDAIPLDDRQVLYRGRDENGHGVVVRAPASAFPDQSIVRTLKQDYDLTRDLSERVTAVPREYHAVKRSCAVVYPEGVGMPLSLRLAEGPLPLPDFLRLATAAAESLRALHAYGLVHRDVRPVNFFVDDNGGGVRIAGLGSSVRSSGSAAGLPKEPVGTLKYMSPEATTRVPRAIDERSDIYSMGITFYEMLVGEPPFAEGSAVALVHAHLALPLPAIGEKTERVPAVVDAIIRRCTQKTPEDRYQSTSAVCDDLKRCLEEVSAGNVPDFEIGRTDLATRLDFGDTLYGRDEDSRALSDARARTAGEKSELVLISGSPGIGKSVLADRLRRDAVRRNGLVLFGKFDQAKASAGIPFSAFSNAFNGLTTQILALQGDEVAQWKSRLLDALGANARIVVDVAPHMELLLGEQNSVEEVGPAEALNRLHYAFRQLVGTLAEHTSCLVVVIDDLQWADRPSLRLLESLLVLPGSKNMLAVGTYRDEETPDGHPLHHTVERVKEAGVNVTLRKLEALGPDSITPLIQDTLRWESEQARELAKLVHSKTAGNPFFIKQLIQSFARQGTIAYSAHHGAWICDIEQLRRVPVSDSVADLLLGSLKDLPSETQKLLTYGAYAGNKFDARLVAGLASQPLDLVVSRLATTISQGLMSRSEDQYLFAHDRIQQAALQLVPEAEREGLALQIGRVLRAELADTAEEGLFDVVGHLNRAANRIDDPQERLDLARLNQRAARAARASAAFEPCAAYLREALSLFDEAPGREDLHDEIHRVLVVLAECEYILTNVDAGDAAATRGLKQAQTAMERAELLHAQQVGYHQLGRHNEALKMGIAAVRQFGLKLKLEAAIPHVLSALIRFKLAVAGREVEALYDVGDSTNASGELIQHILGEMGPSAYHTGRLNLVGAAYFEGARVAIRHGYVPRTITVFGGLSAGFASALKDHRTGYRMIKLALRLGERFQSPFNISMANMIYGGFLSHWFDDPDTSIAHLYKAYEFGKTSGNLPYAAYAIGVLGIVQIFKGRDVDAALESAEEGLEFTAGISDMDRYAFAMNTKAFCLALKDPELSTEFDPAYYNDAFRRETDKTHLARYYVSLMMLYFLRGEHIKAYECGHKALPYGESIAMLCDEEAMHFYLVLCCCEIARRATGSRRRKHVSEARRHLRPLAKWAAERPESREHRRVLGAAMLQTVTDGLTPAATAMIESAIAKAVDNGFLFDAGLANLCAARVAVHSGPTRQATIYFRDACYYYGRINASGAKEFLEREQQAVGAEFDQRLDAAANASPRPGGALDRVDVDTLVGALRDIASTVRLSDVVRHVMSAIIQNAGAERGLLAMPHGGGIAVEALVTDGRVEVLTDHPRLSTVADAPHAVVYYAWRVRETVATGNAAETIEFANDPYVQRIKLKSVLCVPVLLRGSFQGIVCLENNLLPNAFSADRVQIVETLAAQAASAIENARLYQTLEEKVEERTRELRNTQERVVRLEREATEAQMASGFAHEMRNALAAARNNLGQVLEPLYDDAASHFDKVREAVGSILDLVEPVTDHRVVGDVAAYLEAIMEAQDHIERTLGAVDQSTSRALDVTTQILRYSRLVHEKDETETVDLGDLIRGMLEELGPGLVDAGIDFTAAIKSDCMVKGLRTHYYSVLSNIVLNARDALNESDGETRTIEVEVQTDGSNAIVRVIDNGPGMSPEVQDKVFTPFFSTKGAKGTGLGMSVVRRLVGLYDGTIALESEQGEGTAFTLRFPAHLDEGDAVH